MKIEPNKVVTVTYKLDANLKGNEKAHIETAGKEHPLVFLFGAGGMIPAFENNLQGLSKGDSFNFSLEPEHGYGQVVDDALVDLPLDIFKVDGVLDMEMLRTGNTIPMSDREGNRLDGKVIEVGGESVKMDFNHPLAGHELHFTGEVVDIREATEEELSHGHAHTGHHGH